MDCYKIKKNVNDWLVIEENGKPKYVINTESIEKIIVFINRHTQEVDESKSTIWYKDGTHDVIDIPLSEVVLAMEVVVS